MSDIEIDTAGVQALAGRTIVKVDRDPPSEDKWALHDESLTLTLDDGSVWEFVGEGYDSSGLRIFIKDDDDLHRQKDAEAVEV